MSDNNGFRGDTRDKAPISLVLLLQEVYVADTLGLASVRSRDDIIDWSKLLLDDVRSVEFGLQRITWYR